MPRLVNIVSAIMALVGVVLVTTGCEGERAEKVASEAYLATTDIKGTSTNCAVVLRAQQGTSYSVEVTSTDGWASLNGGVASLQGEMTATSKVVYVYFSKNASGVGRTANVSVSFGDGSHFELEFTQQSYDATIAFEREWPELPVCDATTDYIYNSHYGRLGVRENARNYTYCFDPEVRASLWVAYPLHTSHTTGSGDRNDSSFGYDPTVSTSYQANLAIGSYDGWYDRGHQIPAADRKCSQQMMDQTFYATNMTPQHGNFNQKLWGMLEGKVRSQICSDTLYVVTGAWFEGAHHPSIYDYTYDRADNLCPTPTHYFKALLRTKKGNTGLRIDEVDDASQLRSIAFWMEHANTGDDTSIKAEQCISVAELEELTGFDFFPMLDDSIESEVESGCTPSLWGINF